MDWYNPPKQWHADGDTITVTTDPSTDFWQITHYGFRRDNGHFYYQEAEGDFTLDVKIVGAYRDLYDQAGLMVRLDETNWMKCGIEYVNGVQHASAVVTRIYSDWSVVALAPNPEALWLRVKRSGDALEVSFSLDGGTYTMLRTAYFPTTPVVQAGIMCASPDGSGFEARFEGLRLTPVSEE